VLSSAIQDLADTCSTDWDPHEAAHAISEFGTFLAGFVFAGVILIITERRSQKDQPQAVAALKLLLGAFVPLALSAYLEGDTTGEQICSRALSETVLAGVMLGAGAASVLVAIVWLLSAYGLRDAVPLARQVCYCGFLFIVLLNFTSSLSFATDIQAKGPLHASAIWVSAGALAVTAVSIYVASRPPTPARMPSETAVKGVVWVLLGQAAVMGMSDGAMLSFQRSWLQSPVLEWLVFLVTLILPTLPLAMLAHLIPHTAAIAAPEAEKLATAPDTTDSSPMPATPVTPAVTVNVNLSVPTARRGPWRPVRAARTTRPDARIPQQPAGGDTAATAPSE
jgi:hypothetical protein